MVSITNCLDFYLSIRYILNPISNAGINLTATILLCSLIVDDFTCDEPGVQGLLYRRLDDMAFQPRLPGLWARQADLSLLTGRTLNCGFEHGISMDPVCFSQYVWTSRTTDV